MEPKVTCVVLNWNAGGETVACLRALGQVKYGNWDVIVVDNGSTDDSLQRIRELHAQKLLIETGRNLGFAGGNNVGITLANRSHADYIWLLNNDTEPTPNALAELVSTARSNPQLGAIGSVLLYPNSGRTVQAWGGGKVNRWIGYCSLARAPQSDEWFDFITAASMLVPRAVFENIGLLVDSYFLYWEDVEFSFRLRKHGWKIGVSPLARVYHKESASTSGNSPVRDRYYTASAIRFLCSNSPMPRLSVPVFLFNRLGKRLLTGQFKRFLGVGRGLQDYMHQRQLVAAKCPGYDSSRMR